MFNDWCVLAYYTEDTPYETEIANLINSLDQFNIAYRIMAIPNLGDWLRNTGAKPQIILDALEFDSRDILYLDADAVVMKPLDYFTTFDGDIGVHYYHGKEVLSGTIYLRNILRVKTLVQAWLNQQQNNGHVFDQKNLSTVLKVWADKLGVSIRDLPYEYVKIFDKGVEQPIIQHNQASRRFKNVVTK